MENKNVGWLILGLSVVIIMVVFLFNNAMQEIVNNCPLVQQGLQCPSHGTVRQQTYLSLAIAGILIIIGLFLVFSKQREKIIIRKANDKIKIRGIDMQELSHEERKVLKIVQENKAIFQAELIEKTGFGKAKVTRVLDRLESRGFLERKRRGMTNIVVILKD